MSKKTIPSNYLWIAVIAVVAIIVFMNSKGVSFGQGILIPTGQNLFQNGNFESGTSPWILGVYYGTSPNYSIETNSSKCSSGSCLKIGGIGTDYLVPKITQTNVLKGATYSLTCSFRSEPVTVGLYNSAGDVGYETNYFGSCLVGDKTCNPVFTSTISGKTGAVGFRLGSYSPTVNVYVDDCSVYLLAENTTPILSSPTPTPIPTATPTVATTPTPTPVPTVTPTPTAIPTPSPSATPIPTATPVPSATSTPTAAPTATPSAIPTATPIPTIIPSATPTVGGGTGLVVAGMTIGYSYIILALAIIVIFYTTFVGKGKKRRKK